MKIQVFVISILLNIVFHAPMGKFQLELIYYFTYFSTVVPSNSCVFLSCRPFVVNMAKLQHPQDLLKILYNDERPKGKKHTTVGRDDGGKIVKIIN